MAATDIKTIADMKSYRFYTSPWPVFRCKLIGAAGVQTFEGTALAAGEVVIDDINGDTGTPVSAPVGRDDIFLAY
jgi:hypothetical protein